MNNETETENTGGWSTLLWGLAMIGIGYWLYIDLHAVHTGTAESIRVWRPIALVYQTLGFWPSVSIAPLIGIILSVLGIKELLDERK